MNVQSDKNRKTRIITIFLAMVFILAGGGLLAAPRFGDEVLGVAFLFLFALCFSAVAAWSKKNRWAIIPAGFFASLGLVITLESLAPESIAFWVGGLGFMLLLAATFASFAIVSKKNWWAIIPAGFFTSLGLVIVLENLAPTPALSDRLIWGPYMWVLLLGLTATFMTLWLLRKSLPTGWAIYPAAGCLALAVLFIIEGAAFFSDHWLETVLPVIGVTLLLAVLTRKGFAAGQKVPNIKV